MEMEKYKQSIGWGFIALFSVFLINAIVSRIPLEPDTMPFTIRMWWYPLSLILQAAAVILIAFNPNSQASILSKIGAGIYTVLILINLLNRLYSNFTGHNMLYFPGISDFGLSLVLFAPGLLLLIWGLPKYWLPAKIASTLVVVFVLTGDLLWAILANMSQDMSNYLFQHMLNVLDILFYAETLANIATIVLTIVWMSHRERVPYVQPHNMNFM